MFGKVRSFFTAIILLALPMQGFCQYFSFGNPPANARWMQIRTGNYSLIFPKVTDSLARVYLRHLEAQRGAVYDPMYILPKRIPVILHPYTTLSNGVVSWAPKRIELITTPSAYDGSADNWIGHLTLHEMRHAGQIEHYTKGVYSGLYYLFGEQITGLGLGLFMNKYILEGDAVIAETELSRSGRGRSADFTKYLRVLYLNDEFRNWDQLLFGSYRHFSPDIYVFGYTLGSYMKFETGQYHFSGELFSAPVRFWYNIGKLFSPVIQLTGEKRMNFFARSQKTLSELWKMELARKGPLTEPDTVKYKKDKIYLTYAEGEKLPAIGRHDRERLYTEYISGIRITDSGSEYDNSIIAIKHGMEITPQLVNLNDSGSEHFICHFNHHSSKLTYDGIGRIYWSETITQGASTLKNFSVIKYMDLKTGKIRTLKKKTRYFNPASSPDGKRLSVTEYPIEGSSFLTILDTRTGEVLERHEAPEKGQIKESVWWNDSTLYCTAVLDEGLSILRHCAGTWTAGSLPQHQSIKILRKDDEALYFTSDLDGVLNIYRYFPAADSLIRITNSRYGADYPCIDSRSGRLYYSSYDRKGYFIAQNRLEDLRPVVKSFAEPYRYPLAEVISGQVRDSSAAMPVREAMDTIDTFDEERYPAKRYSKLLHAFRFHSWFPFHFDMDKARSLALENIPQIINAGVTVMSQNSLGDIVTTASYGYINHFHTGHLKLDARIVWDLAAEIRFDINDRNRLLYAYDPIGNTVSRHEYLKSPLLQTNVLLYYPLNFNSRGWYRALTPQFNWSYSNDRYNIPEEDRTVNRHELRYGISYGQVLSSGKSQTFPRWGFGITAFGASVPGSGSNFGNMAYLHGYVYLPGILRTQGLKLTASWQKQFSEGKRYYLSSFASLPRGYESTMRPTRDFFKFTMDYALALYLGDFRIGSLFYLQRLKITPFADFAWDTDSRDIKKRYHSFGSEFMVDFHILRFSFPLSMGFRYAHTGPQDMIRQDRFSFLFNLSF